MLTNQRAQLLEKYSFAIKQLGETKNQNRELTRSIQCHSSNRKQQETHRFGEIEEVCRVLNEDAEQ